MGIFRCLVDLRDTIIRYVAETYEQPNRLSWTADPDKIIAAVKRGYQALESIH